MSGLTGGLAYFNIHDMNYPDGEIRGQLSAAEAGGTGTVPEPGSWALMIGGFGLIGTAMRRRQPMSAIAA